MSYERSEDKKASVFLVSFGIDYDSLTQEEFVTVIRVLKKSAHMKNLYSQRGKAPYQKHGKGNQKNINRELEIGSFVNYKDKSLAIIVQPD